MTQQKPSFKIDDKAVRSLAVILADTDLNEIEYEAEAGRIRVVRHSPYAQPPGVLTAPVPSHAMSLSAQGSHHIPSAAPMSAQSTPTQAPQLDGTSPAGETQQDWASHPGLVTSPMVATAYLSPQPGAAAFVKEGDMVSQGQTLLILEAMKVMNPLKSPRSGKVIKMIVQDASPVEYAEPLLVIA